VESAFGAKLRLGALRAFGVERPFAIRDNFVTAGSLLPAERSGWDLDDPETAAKEIEAYLCRQNPKHDRVSLKADEIVERAETDRSIIAVSALAVAVSLSARSIQDICRRALGISPKWVIRCFRLQDALARLDAGIDVNLSALAQDLGYFDQAHFTWDFKTITGVSPGRY
jgi:AraC-like DNA-binding protein